MAKKPTQAEEAYAEALRRIEACREAKGHDIDLYGLRLAALPPEIGRLTALTELNLTDNELTALPREISRLTALTELNLSGNKLTALPPEIGRLTALIVLNLFENQLAALPREISRLTALKRLNLRRNRLAALPREIAQITTLTELYLHDNPALGLPESILGPTRDKVSTGTPPARPADILNFYFSRRSAAAVGTLRPLNEIKVMLVGDGGAGKTSLRRFFVGQKHSEKEPETLGIALDTFPLRGGSTDITVRLWDFAGQEITHALHQFFLTEGCVYLVVVEPRSDNEQADAEKWLRLIARYGNGAPAIVVLNKQDTRQPNGYDVDRNLLRERFPFIRDFERTTCGTVRVGCDELLEKLRAVVGSMPEAKLGVDRSWILVKNECFERRRHGKERQYLSLDEFRALCARHGELDREKQESLARILHTLGAVLHFIDEPRLRDTTVLNPHWVTDGAYRLLRCKDGPGSRGILTLAEAVAAVPSADEKAARYLLGLMERFEMCFPVEDADDPAKPAERWLVPGSLDKNQPDDIRTADWQEKDRVRLRYVYDPLPQGVIPRFIVMTHPMSEGRPRWRNGVVLEDGAARALVRKAHNDNTVEVTVQGPEPDRENLIKVVRGYLARIHRDLPDPKPKESQELSGLKDEFRDVQQMVENEQVGVPIVVKTPAGIEKKNATDELNRSSDEAPRTGNKRPLRVFLSYARDDRPKQQIFRKNLMALESDGYITFWDDPNIRPDMEWRPEVDRELEAMDVFVGLLTTNFVTAKFIQRVEFKRALERRKDKTVKLWLILVDDRRIEGTTYEGIQVLKPGGKAVTQHKNLRAGFDAVEKELHKLLVDFWTAQPETKGRS
jgi:internalin A